jgi:hypothetical protein
MELHASFTTFMVIVGIVLSRFLPGPRVVDELTTIAFFFLHLYMLINKKKIINDKELKNKIAVILFSTFV